MKGEFKNLLQDLSNLKLKVTGSYATGKQNEFSDIDFYCSYSKFNKLKKILKKYDIKWESDAPCEMHTHNCNYDLMPLEFNLYFKKLDEKLPVVEIDGIKFKTY